MNLDKNSMYLRTLLFIAFIGILLGACKSDSEQLPKSIVDAKALYDAEPTDRNRNALVASIYKEVQEESPARKTILKTGVEYGKQLKDPILHSTSIQSLVRIEKDNPKNAERIMELIDIMQNDLKQVNATIALKRGFYSEFPEHKNAQQYKEQLPAYTQNIDSMLIHAARRIMADSSASFNLSLAREFINISEGVVLAHPSYDRATDVLFDAAKTAGTIRDFNKSMALYNWIINEYPEDDLKRGQSIFMKAFTYDSGMKNIEKAKENYQLFLKEYPDHDLADDAQYMVDNLGLSNEELLKKMEQNKKQASK